MQLVGEALDIAGVKPADISCIAYTKVLTANQPAGSYTTAFIYRFQS